MEINVFIKKFSKRFCTSKIAGAFNLPGSIFTTRLKLAESIFPEYKKNFVNKNKAYSITLGKNGSIYHYKNEIFYTPVFTDKVVDTTGCGDAYFAITSLLKIINTRPELISYLGNIYAGMHALNVANKNITLRTDYLKYLKSLLTF